MERWTYAQHPSVGDDCRELGHPVRNIDTTLGRELLGPEAVHDHVRRVAVRHEELVLPRLGTHDAVQVRETGGGLRERVEAELGDGHAGGCGSGWSGRWSKGVRVAGLDARGRGGEWGEREPRMRSWDERLDFVPS